MISPHTADPGSQNLRPPLLNTLAVLLVIAGSLVAVGGGRADARTADLFGPGATLLSVDPRAFGIWWAIIAGLLAFIGWQWLPEQRESARLGAISLPAVIAGVAHLAWILLARADLVVAAVVFLVIELAALCVLVWLLVKRSSPSWLEHLATDVGWGLLLGWICAELLIAVGVVVEVFELAEDRLYLIVSIAALCVFIAGGLGLAGRMYHQFAVGIALLWGIGWIGWARLFGDPTSYLLAALAGAGAFLIIAGFYASGRRRRHNVEGLEGRPWR